MPLDAVFLKLALNEIEQEIPLYVDKIHQPSRDSLVLLLRTKNGPKRLFICASQGRARIHFTEKRHENPETPPMFCMLLRKHIGSGKLIGIECDGAERVCRLSFSASDEMGFPTVFNLVCEFIGAASNIILLDKAEKIMAAVKYTSLESERIIAVGATYKPPVSLNKLPVSLGGAELSKAVLNKENCTLSKAILSTVAGISPLIANELSYKITGDCDAPMSSLTPADKMNVEGVFNAFIKELKAGGAPILLTDENGSPADFTFKEITAYGKMRQNNKKSSYSELLEDFYIRQDTAALLKNVADDIFKLLNNLYSRTAKKLSLRKADLEKCRDREHLRVSGELIKANLYRLKNGMSEFTAQNFYDENLGEITIKLNPALSPSQNADRMFKEYKKSYTAEKTLTALIENDLRDLEYFDSVLDSLARATTKSELSEIREELYLEGYIKRPNEKRAVKKKPAHSFLEEQSSEGYKILIGKNNRQNDELTLRIASKNDMWFHTKGVPGSHVIVFCGGKTVTEETIVYAAALAAKHSKAKESENVAVDYTEIKNVKKPSGAKPGMVIYTSNRTVYVNPI